MTEKPLTIWVVTEGIAGTENQCLGIAEALQGRIGGTITIKRVGLKRPYSWFSPYWNWGEGPQMLTWNSDDVVEPWPDVLIAGGRKAVGIARHIRRSSFGKTLTVMVQDPKVPLHHFDLIAAPCHDGLTGPNVTTTDGAANRITPGSLQTAALKWAEKVDPIPKPRFAVLIGGASKTHRLGPAEMDAIVRNLQQIQQIHGAGLMVTISRRTPLAVTERLIYALSSPRTMIYTGVGDNPYHGFLALADYIVCTSDSVSMLSDAATTGKPVFLHRLPGQSAKFERFYQHLQARGVVREIEEAKAPALTPWQYTPYNDADRVAEAIQKLLQQAQNK